MWCSAFLFVYPKQQGKFCHHVHSNARLSMMVTIDFIRGWHELHGPRCVPAGDLDRPKFQPQIVIFILALSWETGVKHPTPEILQCPEDVMDSITPSSVNGPLTGQVTWNWLGPPEEFSKTESRSLVYLQFQPSGCAPVCSKHYSEPGTMGACNLVMYV